MIRELDWAVLKRDVPQHQLKQGDVGTVVHRYDKGAAFEVEFLTAAGKTIGVVTLREDEVLPFSGNTILHARNYG